MTDPVPASVQTTEQSCLEFAPCTTLFSHAEQRRITPRTGAPLRPIGKEGASFDDRPKFKETCSLIRTPELGRSVARTLGASDAIFLMSHGVIFVGTSVREATMIGIYLEAAVKAQITIAMMGFRYTWPDPDDARGKPAQTRAPMMLWGVRLEHRGTQTARNCS